jgi:hypothetical protein
MTSAKAICFTASSLVVEVLQDVLGVDDGDDGVEPEVLASSRRR